MTSRLAQQFSRNTSNGLKIGAGVVFLGYLVSEHCRLFAIWVHVSGSLPPLGVCVCVCVCVCVQAKGYVYYSTKEQIIADVTAQQEQLVKDVRCCCCCCCC